MHSLNLQINEMVYNKLIAKGVDINAELNDFLENLALDETSYISTQDAIKRVSDAVAKYENKTGIYTPYDTTFYNEMNQYIKSL
jgi:predicted DNA-binding protein YlxM (UPF0122 family)